MSPEGELQSALQPVIVVGPGGPVGVIAVDCERAGQDFKENVSDGAAVAVLAATDRAAVALRAIVVGSATLETEAVGDGVSSTEREEDKSPNAVAVAEFPSIMCGRRIRWRYLTTLAPHVPLPVFKAERTVLVTIRQLCSIAPALPALPFFSCICA